jgi:MFS family permease
VPSLAAKWCLTLTAVSPALGAAAIVAVVSHGSWVWGIAFGIAALLSALISYLVILFVGRWVQKEALNITDAEQADQKVLEFLLAYLLPVFFLDESKHFGRVTGPYILLPPCGNVSDRAWKHFPV